MLTLLTATGCRPQAWALCERWMLRQTYPHAVRWVIVDDGAQPQPITFQREGWTLEVIQPTPRWRLGQNTQARNLAAGLQVIGSHERLVIIEDDDWYAPTWLAEVDARLRRDFLVGECRARYYNLATRTGRAIPNERHASLCSSAMSGAGIEALRSCVQRAGTFIDMTLWRTHLPSSLFNTQLVVGIKGLPGRGGIGKGHHPGFVGQADPEGALLRQWVGDDATFYL